VTVLTFTSENIDFYTITPYKHDELPYSFFSIMDNYPGMNYPGMNYPGMNYPGMSYPRMNYPGMNYPGMNNPE
jgi:hypothetical protein